MNYKYIEMKEIRLKNELFMRKREISVKEEKGMVVYFPKNSWQINNSPRKKRLKKSDCNRWQMKWKNLIIYIVILVVQKIWVDKYRLNSCPDLCDFKPLGLIKTWMENEKCSDYLKPTKYNFYNFLQSIYSWISTLHPTRG